MPVLGAEVSWREGLCGSDLLVEGDPLLIRCQCRAGRSERCIGPLLLWPLARCILSFPFNGRYQSCISRPCRHRGTKGVSSDWEEGERKGRQSCSVAAGAWVNKEKSMFSLVFLPPLHFSLEKQQGGLWCLRVAWGPLDSVPILLEHPAPASHGALNTTPGPPPTTLGCSPFLGRCGCMGGKHQ